MSRMQDEYPRTLHEAIGVLISHMTEEEKEIIRGLDREDLVELYFSAGLDIRNKFGLWNDNYELLISCGWIHPDDASMAIIDAVWQALRGEQIDSQS